MPEISFSSPGPLVANVHLSGPTVREASAEIAGEVVELVLGDVEVGVRFVGPLAVVHAVIIDADNLLARMRGRR